MKKSLLVVLILVFAVGAVFASGLAEDSKVNGSVLVSWYEDSYAKNQLVSFMQAITDVNGPDYIPVENRIAVFDFDGTLFCETDPDYFDHMLLAYRVLEDA